MVQLLDFYDEKDHYCVVLEYLKQDLYRYINQNHDRLTECDIRDIFRQVVLGVQHCHRYGILHRDIKPENIGVVVVGEK